MNKPMKYYIVDVFAEQKYAGNQLAVLPQAGDLSTEQMQQITCEFNFSETTFIPEDPATGSANSCLAGYFVEHKYFQSEEINIKVEQGLEMGRPSRLYLKARKEQDQIQIQVGGKVQLVAEGKLV